MNNLFLAITSLFLILITSFAQAHDGNHAQCYPLIHGEEGQGSTNKIQLPHMHTAGRWNAYIYVTNTGYKTVNVKLNFTQFDGSIYTPVNVVSEGAFSSANSPFDLLNGGGILRPRETARITIFDDNFPQVLTGAISWQADACLEDALVVTVRNNFSANDQLGDSLVVLNGGNPF